MTLTLIGTALRCIPRVRLLCILTLIVIASATRSATAEPRDDREYLNWGVLERYPGVDCVVFRGVMQSDLLLLDDYGSFLPGDTVIVAAEHVAVCPDPCEPQADCLPNNEITAFGPFSFGCGTLERNGEDCPLFRSFRYGDFACSAWFGYDLGDTVAVTAVIDRIHLSPITCPPFIIQSVIVSACADSVVAVQHTSWGRLKGMCR